MTLALTFLAIGILIGFVSAVAYVSWRLDDDSWR